MKKTLLIFVMLIFSVSIFGQNWELDSVFPPDSSLAIYGVMGITVAPDGKVWVQKYTTLRDSIMVNGVLTAVSGILIYNPDGTEDTTKSPLLILGGSTVTDTLGGHIDLATGDWFVDYQTGLNRAHDGHILAAVRYAGVYKIDYTNGHGIAKALTGFEKGGSKVGVDEEGNVYCFPIHPGYPIYKYNSDLEESSKSIAVDETPGFCWEGEVHPDGNTIYHNTFTEYQVTSYTRPNIFAAYTEVDSLAEGLTAESSTWDPKHGHLWLSAGPADGPPDDPWQPHTFYGFDVETGAVVDSITFEGFIPEDPFKHRGMAFTMSGDTVYVTHNDGFGPNIQRWIRINDPVSVDEDNSVIADNYMLEQNYPNPFNPSTKINFSIPESGLVTVKVYNMIGEEVALLTEREYSAGNHTVVFDGAGMASGTYIYEMKVNGIRLSGKMMLLK